MLKSITIVAFDQHAATTVAAVLLPGQRTPALTSLTSDSATILRFVERLRRQGPGQCCYEAGPCGFELQRACRDHEVLCDVIAPALIPRRPGDWIKTDRRDAGQLAILYRAGALTAIHIPTEQEEAARDLLRCREDIRADLLRARHRLSKFLLRHGRRFTGTKKAWTQRHTTWLRDQAWPLRRARTDPRRLSAHRRRGHRAAAHRRTGFARLARARTLAPARRAAPVLPRHQRSHRADDRRRAGRPAALSDRAEHDGLCRPRAVGTFQRRQTRPWRHHENRQCPSATRARRSSGVALPASPLCGGGSSTPARCTSGGDRARLGGPTATPSSVHRFAARGKPNQQIITAVARELTGFVWAALTQ